jgi:3-hydroxyacyl-[acyl-carrier-protein] dehydratase
MSADWHLLSDPRSLSVHEITAETIVKDGSLWFKGHFPGEPVLPGIALLSMVFEMIEQHKRESGKICRVTGFKRVRFRHLVKPGDSIHISISCNNSYTKPAYSFKMLTENELAASGLIFVEED